MLFTLLELVQQSLKCKKGNVGKGLNEKVTTPHQDVRKAFEVKQKEMETSPENPNNSKSLRQDDTQFWFCGEGLTSR